MTTQIQLRRDTSTNWSAANPVLAEGEIGMDMTVNAFKVGDGASAWNDIDYAGTDITLDDYYTKVEADDAFQPKGDYLTDFVEEDPTVPDHVKGITQDDIEGWNAGGSGGTGSSVHIGDTPPANPSEGQQWMEVPASGEATMWIYDGGKWLQHPSGKDGAPGADGNIADGASDGSQDGVVATWNSTAGQWTPDGTVVVSGGNVGIGTDSPPQKLSVGSGYIDLDNGYGVRWGGGTTTSIYGNQSTNTLYLQTSGSPRLTIDATGNATFSGTVNTLKTNSVFWVRQQNNLGLAIGDGEVFPVDGNGTNNPSALDLGTSGVRFKDGYFSGNLYKNGSTSPLINAQELIETLSTLRNATKDETTIKGLRDAIGNAVGGLIEKFEAMQSEAVTQEISDE